MRMICVDDEKLILEETVSMCRDLPRVSDVRGFSRASDALKYLDDNDADIALLDIDLPDMSGIDLAARIKEKQPGMGVIFLTGYTQYAVDAFRIHASGYLLKPVTREMLEAEVEYAMSGGRERSRGGVEIRTFGNFDVYAGGTAVRFKMARCKELLAYLVDRQGSSVTRPEAFAILWEDREYDRSMQKQLDDVIRKMRSTLREYGIEEIFEMRNGTMRVCPETFRCDLYRFYEGDPEAVNSYRGEYMSNYSWASMTESTINKG